MRWREAVAKSRMSHRGENYEMNPTGQAVFWNWAGLVHLAHLPQWLTCSASRHLHWLESAFASHSFGVHNIETDLVEYLTNTRVRHHPVLAVDAGHLLQTTQLIHHLLLHINRTSTISATFGIWRNQNWARRKESMWKRRKSGWPSCSCRRCRAFSSSGAIASRDTFGFLTISIIGLF